MGRLILLAVALVVLVWLIRRALRARSAADERSAGAGELVRCAACGVHLPKTDAHSADGRYYCSDAHARRGPEEGG